MYYEDEELENEPFSDTSNLDPDYTEPNNEFNEEFFLRLICNYPAIYNPQNKAYSNIRMKETAFENISVSMQSSVEICKKKWKSLREKYYREKQKLNTLTRSGAAYTKVNEWPLMSFFRYMFDTVSVRSTASSPTGIIPDAQSLPIIPTPSKMNHISTSKSPQMQSQSGISGTSIPITSLVTASKSSPTNTLPETPSLLNSSTPTTNVGASIRRPVKRKASKSDDPTLAILQSISSSIEEVSASKGAKHDKVTDFANYIAAELRDFPLSDRDEFMDQTIIRLLQVKRKTKKT